jgi:hypothetical protein
MSSTNEKTLFISPEKIRLPPAKKSPIILKDAPVSRSIEQLPTTLHYQ